MAEDRNKIKDCAELEARLTPFVDGEDTPGEHQAVTAHLTACPPCRQQAEDEASARDVLQQHRDELRVTAPESLRTRCALIGAQPSASASRLPAFGAQRDASAGATMGTAASGSERAAARKVLWRKWAPLSVAATLILAVAGVFLFGLNNPVEALASTLALDHIKCQKIGEPNSNTDATVAATKWEHDRGWSIAVPKTLPSEQLTLVDVRHCLSSDGLAAHLMYTWRGTPLSLYVIPDDTGHAGTVDKMGRETIIWCANRRTYAVVADGHPQDLGRIIDYMKANAK
jgi:anti-sigma factor RsiW